MPGTPQYLITFCNTKELSYPFSPGHDVTVMVPDFYQAEVEKAKLKAFTYPVSEVSKMLRLSFNFYLFDSAFLHADGCHKAFRTKAPRLDTGSIALLF